MCGGVRWCRAQFRTDKTKRCEKSVQLPLMDGWRGNGGGRHHNSLGASWDNVLLRAFFSHYFSLPHSPSPVLFILVFRLINPNRDKSRKTYTKCENSKKNLMFCCVLYVLRAHHDKWMSIAFYHFDLMFSWIYFRKCCRRRCCCRCRFYIYFIVWCVNVSECVCVRTVKRNNLLAIHCFPSIDGWMYCTFSTRKCWIFFLLSFCVNRNEISFWNTPENTSSTSSSSSKHIVDGCQTSL